MRRVTLAALVLIGWACGSGWAQVPAGEEPPAQSAARSVDELLDAIEAAWDSGFADQVELTDAVQTLKTILQTDPANVRANLLMGEILLESNDYNTARDRFKAVLNVEPSNFRAAFGYGKILIGNRYWRQAASYLETADRVAPEDKRSEAKRLLALAYAGMGETSQALPKAQEAVHADPESLDALQTLVEIRQSVATRDMKQIEPALEDAERLVAKAIERVQAEPADRERLMRLDEAYSLEIDVLKAHHNSLYQRDFRNQPTDQLNAGKEAEAAAVLNRMANKVRLQNQLRLALAESDPNLVMLAEKAVEYDPENMKYLEDLLSLYTTIHNRERAIDTARRMLEAEPQNEIARAYLTSVGAPLEEPAEATPVEGAGEE